MVGTGGPPHAARSAPAIIDREASHLTKHPTPSLSMMVPHIDMVIDVMAHRECLEVELVRPVHLTPRARTSTLAQALGWHAGAPSVGPAHK